ncbi:MULTISPECIES: TIGR00266 family protein [unclassified Massilia]|uniref:TIGR00266 family protein n=1 Tax=unclassified Massilia TaxID=2609279 RepID=UPI00177D2866|nr:MULTISPECIES: TIGR00266 family protein [unclassified Massilia]MBD8529219.1 TIGR00266 family protein [Massilia sp. CFBP 13647]MBD8672613.1 TIGR00266 family protein [Massilia sp. CFBP 13721]
MPTFTVTGDVDPFLHVSMNQGETIYCESDAMVMMESTLDLKGKMRGGLGSALMRTFANGESFFQQHIEATRGAGDCLLSPTLPGAMQVVDVGPNNYILSDGAFVAASSGVELKVRTQNIGNALFANSGGFFVTETGGRGQVVVSGFGSMSMLDVEPGKDAIIDNSHVVCWDSTLRYEISITTGTSGGFLGNLINSQTSGEGMVLRFSGKGKVYVCSRNRAAFKAWMQTPAK